MRCFAYLVRIPAFLLALNGTAFAEDVVLVDNGKVKVYQSDLDSELRRIPEDDRPLLLAHRDRLGQFLENVLVHKTLALEARELKLGTDTITSREIDLARDRILSRVRLERLASDTKVPDLSARASEQYKLNQDKYKEPELVRTAHILIRVGDRGAEKAEMLAKQLRERIRKGEAFDTLVEQYSEDAVTKKSNGDIGFFPRDKLAKPYADVAFTQKVGDISEVVATNFGFHIIKTLEKKPSRQKPFDEAREAIIADLKAEYLNGVRLEHLRKIRVDPDMKINEEALQAIKRDAEAKITPKTAK